MLQSILSRNHVLGAEFFVCKNYAATLSSKPSPTLVKVLGAKKHVKEPQFVAWEKLQRKTNLSSPTT